MCVLAVCDRSDDQSDERSALSSHHPPMDLPIIYLTLTGLSSSSPATMALGGMKLGLACGGFALTSVT